MARLRSRLRRLTLERSRQRQELRETKQQQGRLADRLNAGYQQLEDANEALKRSQERLRRAQAAVKEAEARVRVAERRLRSQQERFGRRIAYYYKQGSISYVDVLVGSRSISEYLDRRVYVARVMSADADLAAQLRETERQLERQQVRLAGHVAELAVAHEQKASLLAEVASRTSAMERLYRSLARERALQEQELREMEEDSAAIQAMLERELVRRASNPRAFRSLPPFTGNFGRPANGRITSGYGYRVHPILRTRRMHTGIDIGAPMGAPVYAAADGEVLHAGWRGGYGKCIIVLHGGDVSTLYGHLSHIGVGAGQSIRRGQRIGSVGSTGLSTGPHLHFEVRRRGVPVRP